MEEAIEQIVSFFNPGNYGLEENKQILYLLGPEGGAKSSLAECLEALMEGVYQSVLERPQTASPVMKTIRASHAWWVKLIP